MSFLLGALGAAAGPLLKQAGGYLLNKVASPVLSRISSYFTNALGGDSKAQSLGRSVMDRMYATGVDAAYGGMQKFAQSDWLKRKMPIMAPQMGSVADAFKERMHQGYQQIMGGGGGGPGPQASNQDGIEKMQM